MTAKTKTAAKNTAKKPAAEAVADAESRVNKITDGARDYVARTAAAAKDRSDSAFENVTEYNKSVESTLNRVARGYVSILDGFARVSHDNVKHALTTVEKLAAAKSLTETAQIQVDFVRDSAAANYDEVRGAYDVARETVMDGAEAARTRAAGMWPFAKKAA